jgi:hypothetical protein
MSAQAAATVTARTGSCNCCGEESYSYTSSTNSTLSPYQNNLIGSVPTTIAVPRTIGIRFSQSF